MNSEVLPLLQQHTTHSSGGLHILLFAGSWSWVLSTITTFGPVAGIIMSLVVSTMAVINYIMTIRWKIEQRRGRKERERLDKMGPVKGIDQVPEEGTFIVGELKKGK